MKNPLIRWLIALNIICLCVMGVITLNRVLKRAHQPTGSNAALLEQSRYILSHGSRVPTADAERLAFLEIETKEGRAISDADLSWIISLMTLPPEQHGAEIDFAYGALHNIRNPSPQQRDIILQHMATVLAQNDVADHNGFAKTYSCTYLKNINEKRAIPLIRPLLNDARHRVRAYAKKYLIAMGEKIG